MWQFLDEVARIISTFADDIFRQSDDVLRSGQGRALGAVFLGLWGAARWILAVIGLSIVSSAIGENKATTLFSLAAFALGVFALYDWTAGSDLDPIFRLFLGCIGGGAAVAFYLVTTATSTKA